MMAGWKTEKLGDVCAFLNRGVSPKYLEEGGICVLNQKCIRDHRINYEQARRHDIGAKSVSEDRIIKLGDVLVNSTGTGTLGRVAQVREIPSEPTTVDSHVTIVRPKSGKFYSDFFGYMLVLIEEAIKDAGEGCGGQTELARTVLAEKFTVSYPIALPEQQRIVSILDETFEGIATAAANAEKNLANARALFESYLQSVFENKGNTLNEKAFEEICELIGGSQPPKKDFIYEPKDGYIRFVQVRDYRTEKYITYIPKQKARRFCSATDIMIGRYGPPIFGIFKGIEGAYNVALMKAVVNEKICNTDYFFWFLNNNKLRQFVEKYSKRAAGQDGVRKELLDKYPVFLPSLKTQQIIVQKLDVLNAETKKLEDIYQQKIKQLDDLKKSILHKAFSGELKSIDSIAA